MKRDEWLTDKYQLNFDIPRLVIGECRHGYGLGMWKTDPYTAACAIVMMCRGKHLASLVCYDD